MALNIAEALNAAAAAPLIQKRIDPVLLEYQRRYSPLVRTVPTVKWDSNVYYFNQRTSLVQGGPIQDGGTRPVSNSTYVQNSFTIQEILEVGAVTGYAQAVTADLIGNLRATEIEGAARGLSWDIETLLTWGNAGSTVFSPYPQFDGFDSLCTSYSGSGQNAINFASGTLSLAALDQLINMVETNVSEPVTSGGNWMFVMSPTADSKLAQLVTNQQRFIAPTVTTPVGLVVASYRNVPIIKSSFLSTSLNQMSTVTAAETSGGSLADAEYFYQVSAVIARSGESLPSVECNATVASGNAGQITLSFTPPAGFENGGVTHYKVFRSTTTAEETLLGYVAAAVGLQADGVTPYPTNQIVDTGATLIAQYATGPVQPTTYPAAYVGGNTNVIPLSSGDENIYLLSSDPQFVVRPYIREMQILDLYPTTTSPDSLPFAMISDTCLALRAPKYIGRLSAVNTSLS